MSENETEQGADEQVVETDPAAEVAAEPESTVPETVPYGRFSEVIAQRTQALAEKEAADAARQRAEQEAQWLRQQLTTRFPAPQQTAAEVPVWQRYTDPNTQALAKLVYEVSTEAQKQQAAQLSQKLEKYDQYWAKQEETQFWAQFPKVPAEVKAHAETVFNNARANGMQIDRQTALIYARGELAMQADTGAVSQANTTAAQQRTVNAAARGVTATPRAPATAPAPKTTSSADILASIESAKR